MNADTGTQIQQLETQRMQALLSANFEALGALLGDDLVHIHANGQIENKQQYLQSVSSKLQFLKVERAGLNVRVYGDNAIATGILNQTVKVKANGATVEMRAVTTQCWIRREGRWLQISFQATRLE